jgi:hypothetical protein
MLTYLEVHFLIKKKISRSILAKFNFSKPLFLNHILKLFEPFDELKLYFMHFREKN